MAATPFRPRAAHALRIASSIAACVLVLSFVASDTRAAENDTGEDVHARHTIGLFLGATSQDRRSNSRRSGGTLGIEYEYRVNPRLGVGAVAEHVRGGFDTTVLVAPLAYHAEEWKLYAGPGVELSEDGSETLLRLGVEYGFRFGDLEVSPQVDLDFVDGERLFIIGVVVAHPF